MKKLTSPESVGGAPFFSTDFTETMQDNIYQAMTASLVGLFTDINGAVTTNQACVLSGCVVTNASGVYAISSGVVFIDGEIMVFPGIGGLVAPISTSCLVVDTPITYTRSFENGITNTFATEKKAKYVTSLPGSGSYVLVSTVACAPTLSNITGAALKMIQPPSFSNDITGSSIISPSGSTITLLHRNWIVIGNKVVLNFRMDVNISGSNFLSAIIRLPINGISFASEFGVSTYIASGNYVIARLSRDNSAANELGIDTAQSISGTTTIQGQITYSIN